MNSFGNLTSKQALYNALAYAGIENGEYSCRSALLEDGLYHFVVRTNFMNYEFYVDAVNGEVLGISTEPLIYREALCVCESGAEVLPAVA